MAAETKKPAKAIVSLAAISLLPALANASIDFTTVPCGVIQPIFDALTTIAGTMVMIMFIYGGLKYVFSAEDPGGRKAGKMTCIHAIIGGILVVLWTGFQTLIEAATWLDFSGCP